jgi:hypothetical protein
MADSPVTLDQALDMSRRLAPHDQLRLISLLSERLRREMERPAKPVDILTLAGLGAELWAQIDADTYLEQKRASWGSDYVA